MDSSASIMKQRLLYNSDSTNIFFWPERPDEEVEPVHLQSIIDQLADSAVDVFASCVVDRWQAFYASDSFDIPGGTQEGSLNLFTHTMLARNIQNLIENGHDPLRVMLDRAHEHGMKFVASFRMNDMHPIAPESPIYGTFRRKHPGWRLRYASGDESPGLDYAHSEVGDRTLAMMEEILATYDVDGVEFDFMRHPWFFQLGEAKDGMKIMTDLMTRARQLLDAASSGSNRLWLGIRVPASLKLCVERGLDVETWVKQGLPDYICPSDYFFTDFKLSVGDFSELIGSREIGLYPTLQPFSAGISRDAPFGHAEILDTTIQKTAANLFYEHGASGMSIYNWFVPFHQQRLDSLDLETLDVLASPEKCAAFPHSYRYNALWGKEPFPANVLRNLAIPPVERQDLIVLDRDKHSLAGTLQFELSTKTDGAQCCGRFGFKVENLSKHDTLELQLNGQVLSLDGLDTCFYACGRHACLGPDLQPYYEFSGAIEDLPLRPGTNELTAVLKKSGLQCSAPLYVSEVQIDVDSDDEKQQQKGKL